MPQKPYFREQIRSPYFASQICGKYGKSVAVNTSALTQQFLSYIMMRTSYICIMLADWINSLKVDAPLRHIILILSQPVFALTPSCCMLGGEAENTNVILFGFTKPELKLMIYCTQGKHVDHNSTNAVPKVYQ